MSEYKCPHCAMPIYDDEALLCHFCGESLGRRSSGVMGKLSGAKAKLIFVLIVLVIIASFVITSLM